MGNKSNQLEISLGMMIDDQAAKISSLEEDRANLRKELTRIRVRIYRAKEFKRTLESQRMEIFENDE